MQFESIKLIFWPLIVDVCFDWSDCCCSITLIERIYLRNIYYYCVYMCALININFQHIQSKLCLDKICGWEELKSNARNWQQQEFNAFAVIYESPIHIARISLKQNLSFQWKWTLYTHTFFFKYRTRQELPYLPCL